MTTEMTRLPVLVGPHVAITRYVMQKGLNVGDYIAVSHPASLRSVDPPAIATVIFVNAKGLGANLYDQLHAELRKIRALWKHITVQRESVNLPTQRDPSE